MKFLYPLFLFIFFIVETSFAQDLYDSENMTIIEIEFEENDWNTILQNFYNNDDGERLLATVEINGEAFDSVGVRYRGGSSVYSEDYGKNPLNIKLDFVKNQDYQGFEVLKLNNGAKDPSFVREVGMYDVVGTYMTAPKANYALVFVNGNYHGLYANVESINRKFVREGFLSDDENTRFECSPDYQYISSNTPFGCEVAHGSALEYLGDGIVCYFDSYDMQSDAGWEDLIDLTEILENDMSSIRSVLDLDRFIWMCALNNWLVNLDSYLGAETHNYYIFKQDNGLFAPIMEDFNESFGRYPWITPPNADDPQTPLQELIEMNPFVGENDDTKPLLNAIFNNVIWRKMYVAHYRTMLEEQVVTDLLRGRLEAYQNLIDNAVADDPNALYTVTQFEDNLDNSVTDFTDGDIAYGVTQFLDDRYDYLQTIPEFTATPPTIGMPFFTPANPLPGTDVVIAVELDNISTAFVGYRESITDAFTYTPLFDNGTNGDDTAGDGIFGATLPVNPGGVQFYVYAENDDAGRFLPRRAEQEFFTIGASADVVINEVLADNETIQADQDGEFDDWLELYNNTNATIDLSGWYLTDDPTVLNKWEFPNGTFIDGNGYLIVWVDDDEQQAGLHTSFQLSNNGEAILLVQSDLTVVDQIVFGPQSDDISLARCPNGTGVFELVVPTFGEDNNGACAVSQSEQVIEKELTVYPNPARDRLFIEGWDGETPLALIDMLGQVWSFEMSNDNTIEIGHLPSGVYSLQVEGYRNQKIMILR